MFNCFEPASEGVSETGLGVELVDSVITAVFWAVAVGTGAGGVIVASDCGVN